MWKGPAEAVALKANAIWGGELRKASLSVSMCINLGKITTEKNCKKPLPQSKEYEAGSNLPDFRLKGVERVD